MANYVYYINDFYEENDVSIGLNNRSFRYGDGLFETIRVFDGKIPFLSFHLARLNKGLEVLGLELSYNYERFASLFFQILEKNKLKNARLRLMVFRSGGGLYKPVTKQAHVLIEAKSLETDFFELNKVGLNLGIYSEVPKTYSAISMLKTNNALPYIMASNFASENSFDECVLLNTNGNLADCIYSNIFMVKDNYIFTPPITDGAVAGTMQAIILQLAEQNNWQIHQVSLTEKDLLASDEIFLTNAIKGVQWVQSFGEKTFKNEFSLGLINLLNEKIII